jgi:hypothetical protein
MIGKDGKGPGSYALEVSDMAGTSSGDKKYTLTTVLWNITSCGLLNSNERCQGAHRLHIQPQKHYLPTKHLFHALCAKDQKYQSEILLSVRGPHEVSTYIIKTKRG